MNSYSMNLETENRQNVISQHTGMGMRERERNENGIYPEEEQVSKTV